jgi:hypothetical protein
MNWDMEDLAVDRRIEKGHCRSCWMEEGTGKIPRLEGVLCRKDLGEGVDRCRPDYHPILLLERDRCRRI